MKLYDAIVVGAGPAGSMAAYTIAKEGMSVLLIDRKNRPGTPKECAEGVGRKTFEILNMKVQDEWVSNEYDSILVGFVGGGKALLKTSKTKGYVLNRKIFDYGLAMRSREEGAEHLFGMAVKDAAIRDEVIVSTAKDEYRAKILIAADGPQSRIARQAGLGKLNCYYSLQYELVGRCDLPSTLQILLYPGIGVDCYCWIFPKKDSINIGLTTTELAGLKNKLDKFVNASGLASRSILETNSGLIPGHNKLDKIYSERLLVAGDAAGHTNPLTGGGIPAALYDGVSSGNVCIEAIKRGKFDAKFLSMYQKLWDKSPFNKAWSGGYKLKKSLDSYVGSKQLESIFLKVGYETINGRKDMLKKLRGKKFTLKDMMLFYKLGTTLFDKVIDYAM